MTTNNQGHIFIGAANDGNQGGVYRSTDIGNNWDLVMNAGTFSVHSIAINDVGNIYIGKSGFERFLVSYNNGDSWGEIELPSISQGNIVKIFCIGDSTIFLSSWESNGALLLRTQNNCQSWDSVFSTNNTSEYITDITISENKDIYVCLNGYFLNTGGIYRSNDSGNSWVYDGLVNHQLLSIATNSQNDIYTGDWFVMNNDTPGIYGKLYPSSSFDLLFSAIFVTDIAINYEDAIYICANEGVLSSTDYGLSFEYITDTLSNNMELLHIDNNGYLFAANEKQLLRSINSTITSIEPMQEIKFKVDFLISPNPASDYCRISSTQKNSINTSFSISIYSLSGKLINNNLEMKKGCELIINVSDFNAGLYFVKIMSSDDCIVKKLVIL